MKINVLSLRAAFVVGAFLLSAHAVQAADGDFGGGAGTVQSPYRVEDCLDLQEITVLPSAHYRLMNDIDCSDTQTDAVTWGAEGFDPISSFSGSLDGDGHAIDALFMSRGFSGYNGLFAQINGGTVSDFGLTNIDITVDESSYAGTVTGYFGSGTISKVYVTGTITHYGSDDAVGIVGGFVGGIAAGSISDSYAIVDVIASSDADATTERGGGFVGQAFGAGSLTRVYAAGEVTAPTAGGAPAATIGGLIGLGAALTVTDSFWDTDASGLMTSADTEVGKTTVEMQTESTFTDAGWNFTTTWDLDGLVNNGYPYLIYLATSSGGGGHPAPVIVAPQTIALLSPNGGEEFVPGVRQDISYDTNSSMYFVNIDISYDNGGTWHELARQLSGDRPFSWVPEEVNTDSALIRVQLTDLVLVVAEDVSDAVFTIESDAAEQVVDEDENQDEEVVMEWPNTARSPYSGLMEEVTPVLPGSYIRAEHYDIVYYVDADFVRHPFFNETIFATYESSFENIQSVTDATLPLLSLGSPMLPKAGVTLVKLQSHPAVFATFLDENGAAMLRELLDEQSAEAVAGSDWADYVIDLPVTLWPYYAHGDVLTRVDDGILDRSLLKLRTELRIQ